jgi:hypothetical protein
MTSFSSQRKIPEIDFEEVARRRQFTYSLAVRAGVIRGAVGRSISSAKSLKGYPNQATCIVGVE